MVDMAKTPETEEQKKAREFVEATAQAIIDLAEGVRAMLNGRVNKRALVLLIQAAAGTRTVTQEQVEQVINTIAKLDKTYLK